LTLWAFQPGSKDDPAPLRHRAPLIAGGEGRILCAVCGAVIAPESARIEVGGAHAHRFTNPAGFTYDIVCLQNAACYVEGRPTNEHTWFSGYAWSYALCCGCHTHLGWYYEGASKFFALIADRLIGV
jgi:hypothetical protein